MVLQGQLIIFENPHILMFGNEYKKMKYLSMVILLHCIFVILQVPNDTTKILSVLHLKFDP